MKFEHFLTLYPRNFRDEYGREMALVFADRYRHANSAGERALVWLESLAGLAREAPKEHGRMILQDLRYALRTLRRQPAFAATIILTLALGIGANSAIFSLLNAVTLQTLPVPQPGELYTVKIESPRPVPQRYSWPMFEKLRATVPDGKVAAMGTVANMHARPMGAAVLEPAAAQLVSGEYFDVMKVPVVLGRPLTPRDNVTPGAHPVAVLSNAYWRRRFNADKDVLGKELTLNSTRFVIIGVAGEGFAGVWLESPVDAWIPLAMQHDVRYSQNVSASDSKLDQPWMPQQNISWLSIVVRAPNRVAMATAINQAVHVELLAHAESISNLQRRKEFLSQRVALEPFGTGFSRLRERFLNPLYLLMAMAALVLLIACANAANMLLARSVGRQREIAVRFSLGAGRMRVGQQLLTESVVLVVLSSLAAILVAQWASAVLVRMAAGTDGPAPFAVPTDARVLGFTMALAIFSTVVFGLVPALRSTRIDLAETLKSGSRNIMSGGGHARALVVLQVAFSLILISATGLLIRSFQNLSQLDLGFDQQHVLTAETAGRLSASKPAELHRRILEHVRQLPGVESAAVSMCGMLRSCRSYNSPYSIEGYRPGANETIGFLVNLVSTDYFQTMGLRMLAGRAFEERDMREGPKVPKVAIVNESLARRYFPQGNAVGRRLGDDEKLDTEIIGVTRDARTLSVREEAVPMVYYPIAGLNASALEVRTHGDPSLAVAAIRRALAEAAPDVPVGKITVMADHVNSSLMRERLVLSLASAFGGLALLLAGFGLFGILSFAVARRIPEYGIRIALGASNGQVRWSVCREALIIVAAGVALGLPVVFFGARAMQTILFGVSPQDWGTFISAGVALLMVAAIAAFLPAWRASRVDPLVALRME